MKIPRVPIDTTMKIQSVLKIYSFRADCKRFDFERKGNNYLDCSHAFLAELLVGLVSLKAFFDAPHRFLIHAQLMDRKVPMDFLWES